MNTTEYNMSNAIITYNQEEGLKAGGGNFISEGGAYIMKILEAKYTKAKTNTSGIEFSLESSDGQKANYITVYYVKADGSQVKGGMSILNAMMGLLGANTITSAVKRDQDGKEVFICPEFTGKTIGMFLQKSLYTKNDGSDGYKFDIRVPFDPATSKTLREKIGNDQPKTIENMTNSYKDKDDRTQQQQQNTGGYAGDMNHDSRGMNQDNGYIPGFE